MRCLISEINQAAYLVIRDLYVDPDHTQAKQALEQPDRSESGGWMALNEGHKAWEVLRLQFNGVRGVPLGQSSLHQQLKTDACVYADRLPIVVPPGDEGIPQKSPGSTEEPGVQRLSHQAGPRVTARLASLTVRMTAL